MKYKTRKELLDNIQILEQEESDLQETIQRLSAKIGRMNRRYRKQELKTLAKAERVGQLSKILSNYEKSIFFKSHRWLQNLRQNKKSSKP